MMFIATAVLALVGTSMAVECDPQKRVSVWKADPTDCTKFYLCFSGRKYNFTCAPGSAWDPTTLTCVVIGSQWDKCTIKNQLENLTPCSRPGVRYQAKNDNCAQYYDCESSTGTLTNDPHVKECTYPTLFNAVSKRCEPHTLVNCGERKEVKDPCDYVANQCTRSSHCIPCSVRFPSCAGRPDGLNSWQGREWSPFYVVCEKERAVYQGQCDMSHGAEIFNPDKRMCEEARGQHM